MTAVLAEADWQRRVIDTAKAHGWLVAHFRAALVRAGRWATPMTGDVGFPDLVLAKSGRLILAELKTDTGDVTKAQKAWLAALGPYARLWRPRDWEDVLKELSA